MFVNISIKIGVFSLFGCLNEVRKLWEHVTFFLSFPRFWGKIKLTSYLSFIFSPRWKTIFSPKTEKPWKPIPSITLFHVFFFFLPYFSPTTSTLPHDKSSSSALNQTMKNIFLSENISLRITFQRKTFFSQEIWFVFVVASNFQVREWFGTLNGYYQHFPSYCIVFCIAAHGFRVFKFCFLNTFLSFMLT